MPQLGCDIGVPFCVHTFAAGSALSVPCGVVQEEPSGTAHRLLRLFFDTPWILEMNAMSSPPNSSAAEPRTVVPTQKARQGVTGHNVRYVLGVGLAAVIVVFGIIYLVYFH